MQSLLGPLSCTPTTPLLMVGTCTPASVPPMQRSWDPSLQWNPDVEQYLSSALGSSRLQAISSAAVRPPLATCLRVNTLRTTPEDVLRRLPDALAESDKAILVNAEHQPHVHPELPMAVIVHGSGPHPVDYSDTHGLEVIVGRKAGESMLRGANAFAPGILACTTEIAINDLVAVSVGVECAETGQFGVTRGSVVARHLPLNDSRFPQRAKLFLGTGRALVPRTGMNPNGKGVVVTMQDRVFRTPALGGVLYGDVMLQNLPSLVAAVVLGPAPGSRVLDMCAAPGGKTTAMAQLMGDRGEIVALDRSHSKVLGIQALAEELGVTCIAAFKADSTRIVKEDAGTPNSPKKLQTQEPKSERARARAARLAALRAARGEDLQGSRAAVSQGFPPESFDYVLCDAPCSALGLRPRLIAPHTLSELRSHASYQRRLLDSAVRLLRPGGFLVFSTCTINPGENEANARYILDKYPFIRLVPTFPVVGGRGLSGEVVAPDGFIDKLLTPEEAAMVQRFDPSADLDTIGFFIAKFEKLRTSDGEFESTI